MEITYNGYHGTSESARRSILKDRRFKASCRESEWAGTGIYFFVENSPYDNALKWAKYIRRMYKPAVLKANISMDSEKLFDVTIPLYQEQFQRFREAYFQKACTEAARAGKAIDQGVLKILNLDCTTFNKICDSMGFTAVKRQCYIRFCKNGIWKDYPPSAIPNCTILCIRDETQIISIKSCGSR